MARLKYLKPGRPLADDDACGTHRGYYRHYRRGEKACLACCNALAQYEEDRRLAPQRRAVLEEAVYTDSRRRSARRAARRAASLREVP